MGGKRRERQREGEGEWGKGRVSFRARGAHHAHRVVGPYLILVEDGEDLVRVRVKG